MSFSIRSAIARLGVSLSLLFSLLLIGLIAWPSRAQDQIFTPTGDMSQPRFYHTATLLPNGQVLICGGSTSATSTTGSARAEIYDPATGYFTPTGSMHTARYQHTATLLPSGLVLICGGAGTVSTTPPAAELYDYHTGTFTTTGAPLVARYQHSATLLDNGQVLICGGRTGAGLGAKPSQASTELYDPPTGTFTSNAAMKNSRYGHSATLLNNGQVLVAGGFQVTLGSGMEFQYAVTKTAELYDPVTGVFTITGALHQARGAHTATLLNDGKVMLCGGASELSASTISNSIASTEIYDPGIGTFTAGAEMVKSRLSLTATLLPSGQLLIAGGKGGSINAELYDPQADTFTRIRSSLIIGRSDHTATLLPNGQVLLCGGNDPLVTAELYGISEHPVPTPFPEPIPTATPRPKPTPTMTWPTPKPTIHPSPTFTPAPSPTATPKPSVTPLPTATPTSGPLPVLSATGTTVSEGNSGTRPLTFSLTLSKPSVQAVSVTVQSIKADLPPATSGSDYIALPATTVTFAPGTLSQTVAVQVKGDTLDEDNEKVALQLSQVVGATLATSLATSIVEGTIADDDGVPSVSIDDVTVTEGNVGARNANFTVTLSNPSSQVVSVSYATLSGSSVSGSQNVAAPGVDYVPVSGKTFSLAPGQVSKTFSIAVKGDWLDENDEQFFVKLSSPVKAKMGDGLAIGTIVDDDGPPTLLVKPVSVIEGAPGTTALLSFEVKLSVASGRSVSVLARSVPGTVFPATASSDYTTLSTKLTFAPGEVSKTVSILVKGDVLDEEDERVGLELSSPTNAVLDKAAVDGKLTAQGTIVNDDEPPSLSISDVSVREGNSGTQNAIFAVTLSSPSGKEVDVYFTTVKGTASSGTDYLPLSGTLTLAPGQTKALVMVGVRGDVDVETDERFSVQLSRPINATLAKASGFLTIVNDDKTAPSSISPPRDSSAGSS